MLVIIPTSIAEINATKECDALIYNDKFFMVGPEEYADPCVIRMPQNLDIFRTFFNETLLTIETVYSKGQFYFFVDHHKDLDTC